MLGVTFTRKMCHSALEIRSKMCKCVYLNSNGRETTSLNHFALAVCIGHADQSGLSRGNIIVSPFIRRTATRYFSPIAIVEECLCVCVCVFLVCGPQENGLR